MNLTITKQYIVVEHGYYMPFEWVRIELVAALSGHIWMEYWKPGSVYDAPFLLWVAVNLVLQLLRHQLARVVSAF